MTSIADRCKILNGWKKGGDGNDFNTILIKPVAAFNIPPVRWV